jgi:hypothetical protein
LWRLHLQPGITAHQAANHPRFIHHTNRHVENNDVRPIQSK